MPALQQDAQHTLWKVERTKSRKADRIDRDKERLLGLSPGRIANRLFMELCKYERDSSDELWYKDGLQFYESLSVDKRSTEIEKAV